MRSFIALTALMGIGSALVVYGALTASILIAAAGCPLVLLAGVVVGVDAERAGRRGGSWTSQH